MHPQAIDHPSQAKPGIKVFPEKLYVVTAISNPSRYRSRYRLYEAFAKHVADSGAILYTIEMAFGNRLHEVVNDSDPTHIAVRSSHQLWHKENLLNLAINRLPPEAQYIAWIDADVIFARPDWAQETLHQLQHYDVVQMFSHAHDVGPEDEMITHRFEGFMSSYVHNRPLPQNKQGLYYTDSAWHPGYAWAARRNSLDLLGGLIDTAVLGAADHHMAMALIGKAMDSIPKGCTPAYARVVQEWQFRAEQYVRRNVGYVPGTLLHRFHGTKANRRYIDRWKILTENAFDPDTDLRRSSQGLLELVDRFEPRSIKLRDELRMYFAQRNEDDIRTD